VTLRRAALWFFRNRIVGTLGFYRRGMGCLPDPLNSASARFGVILESALNIVSDAFLLVSRKFQGFCSLLCSGYGRVRKFQPTGGVPSNFFFFLLAYGLRHVEQLGQGWGDLAPLRMSGIIEKLYGSKEYGSVVTRCGGFIGWARQRGKDEW